MSERLRNLEENDSFYMLFTLMLILVYWVIFFLARIPFRIRFGLPLSPFLTLLAVIHLVLGAGCWLHFRLFYKGQKWLSRIMAGTTLPFLAWCLLVPVFSRILGPAPDGTSMYPILLYIGMRLFELVFCFWILYTCFRKPTFFRSSANGDDEDEDEAHNLSPV